MKQTLLVTNRNIAARCPEHRLALLDEGCEELLRTAGKHQGAVDEAYAALRDLQCEVEVRLYVLSMYNMCTYILCIYATVLLYVYVLKVVMVCTCCLHVMGRKEVHHCSATTQYFTFM
jgi:hypothetical protein